MVEWLERLAVVGAEDHRFESSYGQNIGKTLNVHPAANWYRINFREC